MAGIQLKLIVIGFEKIGNGFVTNSNLIELHLIGLSERILRDFYLFLRFHLRIFCLKYSNKWAVDVWQHLHIFPPPPPPPPLCEYLNKSPNRLEANAAQRNRKIYLFINPIPTYSHLNSLIQLINSFNYNLHQNE